MADTNRDSTDVDDDTNRDLEPTKTTLTSSINDPYIKIRGIFPFPSYKTEPYEPIKIQEEVPVRKTKIDSECVAMVEKNKGRQFTDWRGDRYVVSHFSAKPEGPIVGRRVSDGHEEHFSLSQVERWLRFTDEREAKGLD